MSASPSFNVDPQVTQEWQRAIKHDKPYRCLQVQFKAVKEKVPEKEGCYFLFRIDDSNTWNLISYVPEEFMSPHEKMLYAAAKSGLKSKLGVGYFGEDWHVNNKKGFTFILYRNETTIKKEAALSEAEKVIIHGLKEEEAERTRQVSDPSLKGKSALNQVGGPLDGATQTELQKYKAGEVSFLHIGVDGSEHLCLEDSKRVSSLEDVKNLLSPGVPGFYLFSHRSGAVPSNIFVYCCPEKSPKNTRLVYATRMKNVRENIQSAGIHITKSIEMQDPKDLDSKVNERATPSYEREHKREEPHRVEPHRASASPKVDRPHPLFGGPPGGQMKKKVVIPPPGAW